MSSSEPTRTLTTELHETAAFIIERLNERTAKLLRSQLDIARSTGHLRWFPDLVVDAERAEPADLRDGPLPVIPFVRAADGSHVGEILLWTSGGYLSGIEFAWITDRAPDVWPSAGDLHFEVPK